MTLTDQTKGKRKNLQIKWTERAERLAKGERARLERAIQLSNGQIKQVKQQNLFDYASIFIAAFLLIIYFSTGKKNLSAGKLTTSFLTGKENFSEWRFL